MPKISVIIPCFNTEIEMFLLCIKSVLSQSFKDFELIIIDDGSSEEYRQAYEQIKGLDSRINVYFKENGGVSSARNMGVKFAKGDYIIFVDSDDLLVANFFEEAYEVGIENKVDIVFGCNIHLQNYNPKTEVTKLQKNEVVIIEKDEIIKMKPYMVGKRLRFKEDVIYIGRGPWTRLVKRELAEATLFDTNLYICEDIVWNLQLLEKSNKICYVKRAWYIYNMHENSAVRKFNPNAIRNAEVGLKAVKEHLNFENDYEYKAFCERCFEDMSRIIHSSGSDKESLKIVKKQFYNEYPWTLVKESRFWKLSNNKTRFKILLYRARVLFAALSLFKR